MSDFVTYSVSVTQEDIDNGETDNECECAVARACRRVIHPGVRVYGSRCSIYEWDRFITEFKLPRPVVKWIEAFDREESVSPISFEVSVPRGRG